MLWALEMILEVELTAPTMMETQPTVHGKEKPFRQEAGPHRVVETRGGGAATSQQQRTAPFNGKLAWDAYWTQFELLAMMN